MASVVFTGGTRSGKSAAAASLVQRSFTQVAVVGFGKRGTDDEFDARIVRHRADRCESWTTLEAAYDSDWLQRISAFDVAVLDCVGTWLALEIDRALERGEPDPVAVAEHVVALQIDTLLSAPFHTVWVTNEVGLSLVPETAIGRGFVDALGRLNRTLIATASAAYLVVSGRAINLSTDTHSIDWPSAR